MAKYKRIYIEITNVCNLSCSFCPKTKRKPCFMSPDEFERVLVNIGDKADYIYLHVMGEPLLHPELDKILDIALKYNKKVVITTNGTLILNQSDVILKSKAVYKIVFSLHSFEANEKSEDIKNYLSNIIDFCTKVQKNGVISVLRLWNFDKETLNGKNKLNDIILGDIYNRFNASCDFKTEIKSRQGIVLSDNIFLMGADIFKWPDSNEEIIDEKAFCYALRDHFGILCDGTVIPCCLDNNGMLSLGNCFEKKLDEILSSEKAQHIYKSFSNRIASEELCKRCEFVTKFKK